MRLSAESHIRHSNPPRDEMSKYPQISIIIPTYNHGQFIGKAITSVLHQTYQEFEIIIVDDGSYDDTKNVVNTFGNLVTYIRQNNQGSASARNTGICASRGEFISFLDADDYYAKDNIEKKISFFEKNQDIDWLYSDWQYIDEASNYLDKGSSKFRFSEKKLTGIIFEELLYKRNFISPCTVMMRKFVLEDVGYFDPKILSQEEYDLWLRISLKYPVHYIDEVLTYVTIHSNSLSTNFSKWAQGNAIIVDKLDEIIPNNFWIKKNFIRKIRADKHTFLARDFMQKKQFRVALNHLCKSIAIFPFQKKIYWLVTILVFRSIKHHLTSCSVLKKKK